MLAIALAFLAGLVTILSPCVLPLLPIILSGLAGAGARRPIGILIGFVGAFSAATLGLAAAVNLLGVPPDIQRQAAVLILVVLGLVMLLSRLQLWFETATSRLVPAGTGHGDGFAGGLALGAGLGFAWTPCVGPTMASVMTLAMSQQLDHTAVLITLAFALGTALPMGAIIIGGRRLTAHLRWFQTHGRLVQQIFGLLLVATALIIWFGIDRRLQAMLLELLPNWESALAQW